MPEKNQPLVANLAGAILFFFVLLFIFAKWGPGIPFSVNQITTNKNDFFSVSAEGKVQTKPDSAEATIGFVGNGKTVIEAQTKTNAVMNKVADAIKKLGVSSDDIKTVSYNVNPEYSSQPVSMELGTKPEFSGSTNGSAPAPAMQIMPVAPSRDITPRIISYSVNSTLQVKIKDLQKVNDVIDTATQNGANQIYGVSFTLADKEKVLSEARKLAIANAKKKATEIAGQAGINLGRIVNIYDNESTPYGGGMMYAAKAVPDAANQTQIQPGSTEIVVNVTLNYETR